MMYSFIPYVFAGYSNNYETNTGNVWKKDFGFDAKIGFSSSMNLDLTYNPDFAQVGADVLADGGNAVDAAVAVGFSLAVTTPRAGNLGGGDAGAAAADQTTQNVARADLDAGVDS